MQPLRTLLMVLIAMAFVIGGPARAMASQATSEPPCHEAPAQHDKSAPAPMAAVNCCAACMPAPGDTLSLLTVVPAEPATYPALASRADGLTPSPDPDPPRASA